MNKRILLFSFFLSLLCSIGFAQPTDTLLIAPLQDGNLCGFLLTVKNRNAAQQSIDEVKLQIATADGTTFLDAVGAFQWTPELTGDIDARFTAQVNLITAGQTLSGFKIYFNIATYDKPVTVNWTTLNGTQTVSSGTMEVICTPFQGQKIDTVTVQASVVNNDPSFNFTLTNRNDFQIPISRFAVQLQSVGAGTIRPSKVSPPTGWELDSVTSTTAYFRTTTDPVSGGESLSGFKVTLRGNPAVNKFTFNWFAFEEGNALLGRDTIRDVSISFTGSAAEADSVYAAVVDGCLYTLTLKNYHVANGLLPSKIRRLALWTKTAGLKFTGAPSAPVNWTKVVKTDSIIYTANHDSASIPSSKVSSAFRFQVDPPSTDPFKIGWRTFRTLVDPLSTGELQLQCSEEPPAEDAATIEDVDVCNWNIRITNLHNTPTASDLSAIELSIPGGSGTLSTFGSSLSWTKMNETSTSVRFTAPSGEQQKTNTTQSILFAIDPKTPGQPVVLTWKTFDDAGGATPLKTGTFDLTCAPVVVLCDTVWAVTEAGSDSCMQNFTVQNKRTELLTSITMEPQNGWKIDTAFAPAGWSIQLDANKTLVNFSNGSGITTETALSGFRVRFVAVDQGNTFGVKVSTADLAPRCERTLSFTCTSGTSGAVKEIVLRPEQVLVVPNPVSNRATIQLSVSDQTRMHVTLLDILGHQVADLANRIFAPGTYSVPLDMGSLAAGTYYVRVESYYGIVTKQVVLTK